MCNLDIIADGHGPINYTQEELLHNWFFGSMSDPAYRIVLLIFGALFLMLVSIVVLFSVMFLKNRKPKVEKPAVETDGSVHIVPFLCSVIASAMLIFGLVVVLGTTILSLVNVVRLHLPGLPYDVIFLYVIIMTVMFSLVLRFSPRASKLFRTWNRIGNTISLAALGVCLLFFGFYWSFYWISLML